MLSFYQELFQYLCKFTGDRERAQDAVQESYARALAAQEKNTIANPRAFLYRTARNVVIDEQRLHYQRHKVRYVEESHESDVGDQPEAALFSEQFIEDFYGFVETLPPRCKEAFVLHKFKGMTHKEVAQAMGISQNAVEKHIIRALALCQAFIEGEEP